MTVKLWTKPSHPGLAILHWSPPPPPGRRVHLLVDTSDSCARSAAVAFASLLGQIAPCLRRGDRCWLWHLGHTAAAMALEVSATISGHSVCQQLAGALECSNRGTWLKDTLIAVIDQEQQYSAVGGWPCVIVATDGEVFDAPELGLAVKAWDGLRPDGKIGWWLIPPSGQEDGHLLGELMNAFGRRWAKLDADDDSISRFLAVPPVKARLAIPDWAGCAYALGDNGEVGEPWAGEGQGIPLPDREAQIAFVGDEPPQLALMQQTGAEAAQKWAVSGCPSDRPAIDKLFEKLEIFSWRWDWRRLDVLAGLLDGQPAELSCPRCDRRLGNGLQRLRQSLLCPHCRSLLVVEDARQQHTDFPQFCNERSYWRFLLTGAGTVQRQPPSWHPAPAQIHEACRIDEARGQRVLCLSLGDFGDFY